MGGNAGSCARTNGWSPDGKRTRVGGCNPRRASPQCSCKTKAESCLNGITFDAGGLIAADQNDRRVLTLIVRVKERGLRIVIPATALAQVMRNPSRQARLCRLLRQPNTDLVALNGPDATAVGLLLARTGTADIADAHVAICAQRTGHTVVTSDPNDFARIAPELQLMAV